MKFIVQYIEMSTPYTGEVFQSTFPHFDLFALPYEVV